MALLLFQVGNTFEPFASLAKFFGSFLFDDKTGCIGSSSENKLLQLQAFGKRSNLDAGVSLSMDCVVL